MKKYTIKDIAELAGVSKGTVDRVIHKRGRVSKEALEKVNGILNKIDYHPNPIAQSLKNNKIYQIFVVLPEPKYDSYWEPCNEGIKDAQKEFISFGISIQVFFFNSRIPSSFIDVNEKVLDLQPDGVLIASLFYTETIQVLKKYYKKNIIVSTFNNQLNSELIHSFVGQNLYQSGKIAGRLLELITPKNTNIAIIHIDETYNNAIHMQQKEKGLTDYFKNKNSHKLITISTSISNLNTVLTSYLKHYSNIKGIFVTNSKTHTVAEYFSNKKDQDIRIVGYDLLNKNIEFLKKQQIDFLIHQNPKKQTHLGLSYLAEHFLFNKPIPKEILLPIDIINSENITSYLDNHFS